MTSRTEEFMAALRKGDSFKLADIYGQLVAEHSLLDIALDSLLLRDAGGDKDLAHLARVTLIRDVSAAIRQHLEIKNDGIL